MFARWRNLAAAAGAFCFPLSLAHALPQNDRCPYSQTAPCSRFQDESSWFRTERDSWYQRYYGETVDDVNPIKDTSLATNQHNTPTDRPTVLILDIESIDEVNDDLKSDENTNECDYINCPCHDILDADDDEADDLPLDTKSTIRDIESELFDVYAPYMVPNVIDDESSKSEPNPELTGTIESILEDSDAAWLDEWFCGDRQSRQDSAVILNEIDPILAPDRSDTDECNDLDGTDEPVDSNNSNDGGPKYHMFYPGCDWSPYYPASKSDQQSGPLLPEDVRSA